MAVMEKAWEEVQKKTFTKWCNSHLVKKFGKDGPFDNISTAWTDGIKLMELVNALYETPFPQKYNKAPKMRPHKLDNIELALRMLEEAGVKTNFLKHTHLIDSDTKMLLGMVWAIILDYQIKGITVEEMSAKEGLLLWCKKKTAGYKDVKVENFTNSWTDGLAFCALIHRHRPDLLDFDSLKKSNARQNLELAFSVAEEKLGIPRLLDVEDLLDVARPDERSVVTYVSEYFHCFSAQNQVEIAGRRIANLVALAKANDELKNEYVRKAQALVDWINQTIVAHKDRNYDYTLESIEAKWDEFKDYKKSVKPPKTQEKLEVETHLNQLQAKLRLNNRAPYQPPEHLTTKAIDNLWNQLGQEEKERSEWIRKELERQQRLEAIASRFWRKAAGLLSWGASNQENLSSTDYGDSVAAVEAKLKNHEGFEANFQNTQKRLDNTKSLGAELIQEGYGKKDAVQAKIAELDTMWGNISQLSQTRRAGLEKELNRQKYLEDLRLQFATQSRTFANWIEDAEDGELSEPTKSSSLEAIQKLQESFAVFNEEVNKQQSDYNALLELSQKMEQEGIVSNNYAAYTFDQITEKWNRLQSGVAERKAGLDAEAQRQSENDQLNQSFAQKAKDFTNWANSKKNELASVSGALEAQLSSLKATATEIENSSNLYEELVALQLQIDERNIFFNPHTDDTIESIKLLWDNLNEFAVKQQRIVEKQILEQSGSGVSEEQLNEFKETFKNFDKDNSGTLEPHEFKACLNALGHDVTSEESFKALVAQVGKISPGSIQFEEFVEYMIQKTEDSDSPNTVKNAFKTIAGDKDYVTVEDLKKVPGLDQETIDYLLSTMPNNGGNYNYNQFTDKAYQ